MADLQANSEQHQKMQKDMVELLRGNAPTPSREAGAMYSIGYYVSIVEPELHGAFLRGLWDVCDDYDHQSRGRRETVSLYIVIANVSVIFGIFLVHFNMKRNMQLKL